MSRPFLYLITSMKKILILGIGNILLGDEGFGVRAAEWLKENYEWPENVQLLDGGTRGLLLMADLLEHDLVIILDIVRNGEKPGTMYIIENEGINNTISIRDSEHQTGITDVLASCALIDHRPEALIFGFEPFDFGSLRAGLSPEAEEKLPLFCENVLEELRVRKII